MILIVMQFQSIRELVQTTQGIESVMRDTPKLVVVGGEMRDFWFLIERPPLPKK